MPDLQIIEEEVPEHPKDDSGTQLNLAVDIGDGFQSQALCDLHVGCTGACVTSPLCDKMFGEWPKAGAGERALQQAQCTVDGCEHTG